MFLPLHDGVPLQHMKTPFATRSLIAACTLVYLFALAGPLSEDAMVAGLGLIPSCSAQTASRRAIPSCLPP